jgi:hypothetical protein
VESVIDTLRIQQLSPANQKQVFPISNDRVLVVHSNPNLPEEHERNGNGNDSSDPDAGCVSWDNDGLISLLAAARQLRCNACSRAAAWPHA